MKNNNIYNIVITGLGIALVFVATMFVKIPNGIQGYINLGDGFILVFSSFLSPFSAFMVGGVASALADVAGGYGIYFFFTLIIKGIEALVVSLMAKKTFKHSRALSYILGTSIMISGYFITSLILTNNLGSALAEIPGNLIQGCAGLIIANVTYPIIKKNSRT